MVGHYLLGQLLRQLPHLRVIGLERGRSSGGVVPMVEVGEECVDARYQYLGVTAIVIGDENSV
jgi:hypothetical protein